MCSFVPKTENCTSRPIRPNGLRGWRRSPLFVLWASRAALALVGATTIVPIGAGMPSELFINSLIVNT